MINLDYDPYFTGEIPAPLNGRAIILGGHYMGGQYRTESQWAAVNMKRCMRCHPNPVPPFPDCPHGHYLTPGRIQEQLMWDLKTDAVWYTLIWVVTVFIFRGFLFWDILSTAAYLIWLACFAFEWNRRRKTQRILAQGGPWSENASFSWEKRDRRNEPWVRKFWP